MGAPLRVPSKLLSAPVLTSAENKCTCCLLHPIGKESSAWSSSSSTVDSQCMPLLLKDAIRMGVVDNPKISFYVDSASPEYPDSIMKWNKWVSALAFEKKFRLTWELAGITDAIMVTSIAADIRIDQEMMEALFGFWCSATNTFIFPWGETGFTPEDSHIFTALPLRGSDLDRKLTTEEEELKNRLIVEAEKIIVLNWEARHAGMVTPNIWLEWFINEKDIDGELKHLGFLTYWLCKGVFPSANRNLAALFGLAARLSLGDRIALAPALVANIYHELNAITTSILSSQRNKDKIRGEELKASASFGFLQCWVWERFESIRPTLNASIFQQSRVRIARWSGIQSKTGYAKAMEIFQDERCFGWRPYSYKLNRWAEPEWYNVESRLITIEVDKTPAFAFDFLALVSCTFVQGLSFYGHAFSESYNPNRFARQFGFDQAIPRVNEGCRTFNYHDCCFAGVQVCIPGITRHGNPRRDYVKWWKTHTNRYTENLRQHCMPNAAMQNSNGAVRKNWEEEKCESTLSDINNTLCKKRKADEINKQQSVIKQVHINILQQLSTKSPLNGSSYSSSKMSVHSNKSNLVEDPGTTVSSSVWPSCNKDPDIINIDSDDEENLAIPNVPPVTPEDTVHIIEKNELALVKELEQFQSDGLMTYQEPRPETEDNRGMLSVKCKKDPYGQEAIDCYPNFFRLIPQQPHYKGFLEGRKIAEDMKHHIFLGQWYMLVRLMEEALCTNVRTNAMEIEQMYSKVQMLEKNGFDVRHLIARLKLAHKIISKEYFVKETPEKWKH